MTVSELKAKIKSGQLPDYLIFIGDEWKVQEIYIEQIAKKTGGMVQRIDSVEGEYRHMANRQLLDSKIIYIVRDDKDLMQNDELQKNIDGGILGGNTLIHIVTAVDKRTRFYKAYKDIMVEFEPLPDAVLKKYVAREVRLSDHCLQLLIDICEHDYGRILLEVDKLKAFAAAHPGEPMENHLRRLVREGVIYEPPYDAIFDLVAAILDRKAGPAFNLLAQARDYGEATMVMLSVLYSNARAVLQVQSYVGDNLANATGLTGWQIKNAKPHVGKYGTDELIRMLQNIQSIESGIKTGTVSESVALEYLLVSVL